MIKETTKTVYTTTDGTEFTNKSKAEEYEKTYLEIKEIAKSLVRVKEICRDCDSCTECPLKRFFPDYTSKFDKNCPFGGTDYPSDAWGYIEI